MSDNPFAPPNPGGEIWPSDLEAEHRAGLRGESRIGWRGDLLFIDRAGQIYRFDRRAVAESTEVRMIVADRIHLSFSQPVSFVLPLEREAVDALRRWLGPHDDELRRRSLRSGAIAEILVGCIFSSALVLGQERKLIGEVFVGLTFLIGGLFARLHPSTIGKYALACGWLALVAKVLHDVIVVGGALWEIVLVPIGYLAVLRHWRVAQYLRQPMPLSGSA